MQNLDNPQHPLWATVRFGALCIAVTFVLWRNANSFDETEIKTIIEIGLMAGGYEGIMSYMSKKKTQETNN